MVVLFDVLYLGMWLIVKNIIYSTVISMSCSTLASCNFN
jgi:hypothetical protein